jgi:hypothetical protein
MWKKEDMPDPMGGKRLLDYDCKVSYKRSSLIQPRKIRKPDDMRPGTKKGKLDTKPIWIVEIQMPKTLIADIYAGSMDPQEEDPAEGNVTPEAQPADDITTPASDASVGGEDMDTDLGL